MNGFFQTSAAQPGAAKSGGEGLLARARNFMQSRPDREHEIILNRLVICAVGVACLCLSSVVGWDDWTWRDIGLALYLLTYSLALLAHMVHSPGVSVGRRVAGIFFDLTGLALYLHFGGERTAYAYPVLLWAIFGNGFRFGVRYLFIATAMAVVWFGAVILTTDFWMQHPTVSIGLLLGLAILPTYTSVLIRQLSEAKRLAEEANKAKTLFLASVSHELRTPLNAIIGLSDLLVDSRLDEEQIDMSRVIGRSGRSLLSLINSILDISRMECGYPNAKVADVDLYAFLADLRDMLSVQAQSKNIRFSLHIKAGAPRFAAFNPRHVEEILVNLAGNAIKFTDTGFAMIVVDGERLPGGQTRLRFEVADTGIGIAADATERIFDRFTQADETIIDRFGGTGLGLAIAKQLVDGMSGRIGVNSVLGAGSAFWFEIDCETPDRDAPPVRDSDVFLLSRNPALQSVASGVCPGISILAEPSSLVASLGTARHSGARHIVAVIDATGSPRERTQLIDELFRRAGGVDVSFVGVMDFSRGIPSRETTSILSTAIDSPVDAVSLERALSIAKIDRRKEAPVLPPIVDPKSRTPLNVLVAEDNRTNQLVIRKILERAGHHVTMTDDGQAALEFITAAKFDLAFMDINMPVLNGIDAMKLYQFAVSDKDRTPIAALTADATEEMRRRCHDAGMIACITKPIEPDRLIAWIDAFVADRALATNPLANDTQPMAADAIEAADATPIDNRALRDLKSLGGDDFVSEIVDQFLGDAASVLKNLHSAVAEGDVQRFRDEAHALRSCAANVGAQKVYKLCLEWRAIDARELAIEGEMRIRRLETEFERAREALIMFRRAEEE